MSARDYVDAIRGLGLEVVAEADLGCYQGDWVGVVRDWYSYDKEYGFIVVGYGSCSGCDSWQAANDAADRAALLSDIVSRARWFEDAEGVREYVTSAVAENVGFFVHEDGWGDFTARVREVLS